MQWICRNKICVLLSNIIINNQFFPIWKENVKFKTLALCFCFSNSSWTINVFNESSNLSQLHQLQVSVRHILSRNTVQPPAPKVRDLRLYSFLLSLFRIYILNKCLVFRDTNTIKTIIMKIIA